MNPEPKRPVVIEDLLRLKRTERPPAEFWADFDQKLRAKQLAALVGKRPWWHSLPSPFALIARHRVPFGAAAAFVLTVMAVREYRAIAPVAGAPIVVSAPQDIVVAASQPTVFEAPSSAVTATAPAVFAEVSSLESIMVVATADAQGDTLAAPLASTSADASAPASLAVAAPYVSLALSKASLGSDILLPARVAPAGRAVVDPLQQMTPPGESRRSARLLAAMVSSAAPQSSSRLAERAASRISEETVYEQVSRFGARGDRFNVKF